MDLVFGLFVAAMARWVWPGCLASARCRRSRRCRQCTLLVPCDVALRQLCFPVPQAQLAATSERCAP